MSFCQYVFYVFLSTNLSLCQPHGQRQDGFRRVHLSIENVIDGVENRHVYMRLLVKLCHTLCAVVAFCHHLHLELCTFYAISSANHRTERTIT